MTVAQFKTLQDLTPSEIEAIVKAADKQNSQNEFTVFANPNPPLESTNETN